MCDHDMKPVEKPAVKSAKTLCMFVLAICIGGFCFYLQAPPATKALIDQYDTWPVIVVVAIVGIVALRAVLS